MTIEHTLGEMAFGESATEVNQYSVSMDGNWLARIVHSEETPAATRYANLRRLVACWNACHNITTESLEENGAAGYEHTVGLVRSHAELLAALRSASAFFESYSVGAMSRNNAEALAAEELESIRALIAKIGGAA